MGEQERPAYKIRGSDLNPFMGNGRYLERNREAWMAGDKRVRRREKFLAYYSGAVILVGAAVLAISVKTGLELLLNG